MVRFRTAQIEDLGILNTISFRSKGHWGYGQELLDQWKDQLTIREQQFQDQQMLVAMWDDLPIGFCSIAENQENYEILHLWVLPEYIGQGYGKKLLQTTIKRFAKRSVPIIVEADPNAEPFYQSQGFSTFDKVESYPPGRFLPVMKRSPQ